MLEPTFTQVQPSPDQVRGELQSILVSTPFATATRARRFLTYIVEQTLAGHSDGIKELILGTEVFDRAADFDPKIDTIVRVEAGKLRKRLEEYYSAEGVGAALRIEVPKGSYVPVFHFRDEPVPEMHALPPSPRRPSYAIALAVTALLAVFACWSVVQLRTPAAPATPSIAVLPFLNLSPDPANEYFADGLAEDLTDALANAGGLRVASRTSAFSFKGKPADAHEIAARLHVAFMVEGSVRRQGDQLKVTAQLIRTDDGYHVWSGSFERKLSDVFAVQQELAGSLVGVLRVRLTGEQSRRLRKTHTANQEAFDLYLQGKYAASTFGPGALDRAGQLFEQSIAADPSYALSYVALAQNYDQQNILSDRPPAELVAKAEAASRKALELDNELPDAYVVLGMMEARHEYDFASAERHLRHALDLNPSSALAHYNLSTNVLAPQERWQEALDEMRLARELDPLSGLIMMGPPWLATLQRRHDAAISGFRALADASGSNLMAEGGLIIALAENREYAAALEGQRQLNAAAPSVQRRAMLGALEALNGNREAGRKIASQLQAEAASHYVSPVSFAILYMGLGDRDNAFRHLREARAQKDNFLIFARVAGVYDPIRSDSRFPALLTSIGLSDEQIQQYKAASHR